MAVDTLGHLLALCVTPAYAQDRAQVGQMADAVQQAAGESVELAHVDRGYTGVEAASRGIHLEVVKLPEAKRGFVLLPRRRVVGWSLGRMDRSVACRETTSACRGRWPACTTSPSAS
jgi:hypothetical protein